MLGVDVAEEPLRRARAQRPGARAAPASTAKAAWQLEDASFDVVWAGEVIEHVADTAAWLSEVRRVLRSGGRLLLSTPDHGRADAARARPSQARAFAARFDPR